jgi:hypothetical protein
MPSGNPGREAKPVIINQRRNWTIGSAKPVIGNQEIKFFARLSVSSQAFLLHFNYRFGENSL